MNISIKKEDFPSLFLASDDASVRGQKYHLRLMSSDIILMIMSVILSIYAFSSEPERTIIAICSSVAISLAIILTLVTRIVRYDKIWYDGRAVAESVKTITWRYMTGAEPFQISQQITLVDKIFISALDKLLKERKSLYAYLGGKFNESPQITSTMRNIRGHELNKRKEIYVEHRIKQQRNWYNDQCKYNRDKERKWFIIIVISQVLALISSIMIIQMPESIVNLTGLFITIAASAISWLQLKQHQELAQSYGLASQELGFVIEQSYHIVSENELSEFVSDSENAISREHTMWLARRDAV